MIDRALLHIGMAMGELILRHELTREPKATLKRRFDGTNINAVGHNNCSDEMLTFLKKVKTI